MHDQPCTSVYVQPASPEAKRTLLAHGRPNGTPAVSGTQKPVMYLKSNGIVAILCEGETPPKALDTVQRFLLDRQIDAAVVGFKQIR